MALQRDPLGVEMNGMVLCRVHPSERFLHVQYLNFTLSRSVMLSQAKSGDQWRQRSSNCRQCKPTPRFICLISWILKCTSAIKMPRPLILPLPLFLLLFSFTLKHTLSAQLDYEMRSNESHRKRQQHYQKRYYVCILQIDL